MTTRKSKPKLKLLISEITAIAVNVIPLALWFFEDYTVETIVVPYAPEGVPAMLFALLCVLYGAMFLHFSAKPVYATQMFGTATFSNRCGEPIALGG